MLVLTRHASQSIVIGRDIVVTVLGVRGDHVRLGIRAPQEVEVHREEVFAAIHRADEDLASPVPDLDHLAGLRPSTALEAPVAGRDGPTLPGRAQ